MEELTVPALAMATLGQAALCVTILSSRSFKTQSYVPLLLFFFASGIIATGPAVIYFTEELGSIYLAFALPALLMLGPSLWLYTEGLTSKNVWRLRVNHMWHYVPTFLGVVTAVLIALLPEHIRTTLFREGDGPKGIFPNLILLFFVLLILGWLPQSTYYLSRIFRRLSTYRLQLKDLFASNEGRELRWLGWLALIIGGVWTVGFAAIISDVFFLYHFVDSKFWAVIWFLLIWSLALWGLRQKPGFEGRYLESQFNSDADQGPNKFSSQKYERSALGDDQAQRIAKKIEYAMSQEQLYLDPNLSLQKLSKHLGVSSNFISQILNETIGENFFDYVNRWRIEAAKPMVVSGDSTVLAIAMNVGFNARSSFYKAFRNVTGETPRSYRMLQGRDVHQ